MGMIDWLTGKQAEIESNADEMASEVKAESVAASKFARVYLGMVYSKIMHECADRASIPEGVDKSAYTATVYDSYSPFKRGLVSLLVAGMINRDLSYYRIKDGTGVKGAKLFDKITSSDALDEGGSIKAGVLELDFREFKESKVLEMLFSILSGILQSMSNGVTITQAVLFKIHELSKMMDNQQNMEPLIKQMRQINDAITQGLPGVLDAKSGIEFPEYDAAPAEQASALVFKLISSLTGLPASYLFGEVVGGLGDTSNSDETRMDAAVRQYYHPIYAPALLVVFNKPFEYQMPVSDWSEIVPLMKWIEETNLLTAEGKKRILLSSTPLTEGDINVTAKQPATTNQTNTEGK